MKGLFAGGQLQSGPDARQVVDALFERSWRVVHVAGHGEPVDDKENRGGVVLSNDTFLGAAEIKAMRVVPELVFVNCCHLAAGVARFAAARGPAQPGVYDRAAFASSVAQALIEIGVRCVVAAGWAVDDQAASAFATTFYDALLRGQRFIDAVAEARAEGARVRRQHVGGLSVLRRSRLDASSASRAGPGRPSQAVPRDEFDDVGSQESLRLALETLIVQSTFQGYDPAYQLDRLGQLEQRWEKMRWPVTGRGGRAVRQGLRRGGRPEQPRSAGTTAPSSAAEGDVSFRMLEQASNLRIRQAVQAAQVARAEAERRRPAKPVAVRKRGAPARRARQRQRREAAERVRAATAVCPDDHQGADEGSRPAVGVPGNAPERESLRGAAMKRLAMLEADAGRPAAARQAIDGDGRHYRRALEIAAGPRRQGALLPGDQPDRRGAHPHAGTRKWKGLDPALFKKRAAAPVKEPDRARLLEPGRRAGAATLRSTWQREHLAEGPASDRTVVPDVFKRSQGGSQWRSVHDNLQFVLAPYFARVSPAAAKPARAALDFLKELTTARPAGG